MLGGVRFVCGLQLIEFVAYFVIFYLCVVGGLLVVGFGLLELFGWFR